MKKTIHILLQIFLIAAAISGITIDIIFQIGPLAGLNLFSYYTFQSNLIVAAILFLNLLYRETATGWLIALKCGATVWILITGLVFHFMLSQVYHPEGILKLSNLMLHYVVPAGMLLNWLIFEKKGSYRHIHTFIWIGYPLIYGCVSLIRGKIDGFYPYWFINPVKDYPKGVGSYANVFIVMIILFIVFSAIGNFLVVIDRYLSRRSREKDN